MGKGQIKKTEIRGQIVRSLGRAFGGDKSKKAGISLLFLSLPEHLVELFRHSEGVLGIAIRADLLGGLGV